MELKSVTQMTFSALLIPLIFVLTSCASASEPEVQAQAQAQVDVCKEVMSSVGRYADLAMKLIDEPEKAMAEFSKTSSELNSLAASLPAGPQRDYVQLIADDFKKMTDEDAGMEAALSLTADVRAEKLQILCPNS